MGFAVDAPAGPMVAGARHLQRNPQYIGTVSTATYMLPNSYVPFLSAGLGEKELEIVTLTRPSSRA